MKKNPLFSNLFVKAFIASSLLIIFLSMIMATKIDRYSVGEEDCMGCGTCVEIAPELFKLVTDGSNTYATPLKDTLSNDENRNLVKEAQDACPANTIWTNF